MGMKKIDLAMLPQAMRSVSSAIRRPNAVHVAGTTIQPQHVVAHPFPEFRIAEHLLIVRKTDKRIA